ncbi:MFS-type transporter SLC18B1-like [Sycon ciliatum]|uniref:MFS-type transporter SLC18B1-like n=1 Tax=Sycon ciliatum TaxID=27933 RepID=UPI0031F70097
MTSANGIGRVAPLHNTDGEQDLFSGRAGTDEAAAGSKKKVYLVYGCIGVNNFFLAAAISLMMPIMALEAELKNPDSSNDSVSKHAAVGLVFSIAKFTEFVAAPGLSLELRNIGSKYILILSGMGVAGCLILFGFIAYVDGWIQFLLLSYSIRIAQGLFTVANFIAAYGIMVITLPDNPVFANGSMRAFNGLGYAFGPFLGGSLYDVGGFTITFLAGGIALFILSTTLIVVMPAIEEAKEKPATSVSSHSNVSKRDLLSVPWLWAIIIQLFLGNFLMGAVEPTLPLYFIRFFNLSTSISGLTFLMYGILYSLVAALLGHIVDCDYISIEASQLIGLASCGLACQLVGPALFLNWPRSSALSFLSMIFFAIGTAALLTVGLPDMARTWSERGFGTPLELRHAVSGVSRAAMSLGYGSGPIVGSSVVAALGFQNGMSAIGGVYFSVGVLVLVRCLYKYVVLLRLPGAASHAEESMDSQKLMEDVSGDQE